MKRWILDKRWRVILPSTIAIVAIASGLIYRGGRAPAHRGGWWSAESRGWKVSQPPVPLTSGKREITLFFADIQSLYLVRERREILKMGDNIDQIRETIYALAEGSRENLGSTLSPETRLRNIFLDGETIYLNFGPEIANSQIRGSSSELLTIYSIVNTMVENFPPIKRVQILIDDRVVETLKGHIDCTSPFLPNWELVKK